MRFVLPRSAPLLLLGLALAACTGPGAAPPAPLPAAGPAPAPTPGFTLARGEAVVLAPGLRLVFEDVEDSRCPPDVHCVWAGRLRYRFSLAAGSAAPDLFTLGPDSAAATPAALGGRHIVLDGPLPAARAASGASPDYRAHLRIVPD